MELQSACLAGFLRRSTSHPSRYRTVYVPGHPAVSFDHLCESPGYFGPLGFTTPTLHLKPSTPLKMISSDTPTLPGRYARVSPSYKVTPSSKRAVATESTRTCSCSAPVAPQGRLLTTGSLGTPTHSGEVPAACACYCNFRRWLCPQDLQRHQKQYSRAVMPIL